jgi:hypothetical protein
VRSSGDFRRSVCHQESLSNTWMLKHRNAAQFLCR